MKLDFMGGWWNGKHNRETGRYGMGLVEHMITTNKVSLL